MLQRCIPLVSGVSFSNTALVTSFGRYVDTGNSSTSTTALSTASGYSAETALNEATISAASAIGMPDAQPVLLKDEELTRRLTTADLRIGTVELTKVRRWI